MQSGLFCQSSISVMPGDSASGIAWFFALFIIQTGLCTREKKTGCKQPARCVDKVP